MYKAYGLRQSCLGFDDDGGNRKLKTHKFSEIPLLHPCAILTISRYLYSSGQQASESYHTLHQMQGWFGLNIPDKCHSLGLGIVPRS